MESNTHVIKKSVVALATQQGAAFHDSGTFLSVSLRDPNRRYCSGGYMDLRTMYASSKNKAGAMSELLKMMKNGTREAR